MSDRPSLVIRQYHPATFLERGVAIPFTTPLLYGSRARPGERYGTDLIIPNPSGGRGVYILSWAAMAQLCTPTLHDRIFNEQIAMLPAVTPATIRRVARAIAMEGLAGGDAKRAAQAAIDAERNDRMVTNYNLLMRLVAEAATAPMAPFARTGPQAPNAARQAQLAVDWASRSVGRPAAWVASALEALADIMTPLGTHTQDGEARLPRLIATLRQVRAGIEGWAADQVDQDLIAHCQMVRVLADLTLMLGASVLKQAQDLTTNMIDLLRRWGTEPEVVADLAARPDWLLDGWEQICLIWNYARDEAGYRAAIAEIVGLTPMLPKEADNWLSGVEAMSEMLRFRRLVPLNEDWRTGVVAFTLIERNEHFRAMAA